jgi:protein-disulfide isomerase
VLKDNEQKLLKNDIHIIYDVVSLNYTEPSFPAVKAVYCANEQNKFFELNEIFFNKANESDTVKDVFTTENILALGKQIGLNKNFEECFLSDKYDKYIYDHSREYISNLKEGESFGFPSTYINGNILTKEINNQQMPLGYTPFSELNDNIQINLK